MKWMERFTEKSTNPVYEKVHRGDGVAVVTNMQFLLMVNDPAATFDALTFPVMATKMDLVRGALKLPIPPDAMRATLPDLWLYLDRIDRDACPWCETWRDAGMACEECEGRGWWFADREPNDREHTVTVCGHAMDRLPLAWWLAPELADLGEDCWLWIDDCGTKTPMLFVASEQWRVIGATLAQDVNPGPFRCYAPGAGAWWAQRRDATARWVGVDWAQEHGCTAYDLFGEWAEKEQEVPA